MKFCPSIDGEVFAEELSCQEFTAFLPDTTFDQIANA